MSQVPILFRTDAEFDACFERHLRAGAWAGLKELRPDFASTLVMACILGETAETWRVRAREVLAEFAPTSLTKVCILQAIEHVFTLSKYALAAEQVETALLLTDETTNNQQQQGER